MAETERHLEQKNKDSLADVSRESVVYRELPNLEPDRLDVLTQLTSNLSQLEDLHGRLRFVMNEVRSIVLKTS